MCVVVLEKLLTHLQTVTVYHTFYIINRCSDMNIKPYSTTIKIATKLITITVKKQVFTKVLKVHKS